MTEKTDKEKTGEITAEDKEKEQRLISILEAKGLSLNDFNGYAEALDALEEALEKIEAISKRMQVNVGSRENPLFYDSIHVDRVEYLRNDLKLMYKDAVKRKVSAKFKNVKLDEFELLDFLSKQKKFDPKAIALHIVERCGANEELESLRNIQKVAKEALPPRVDESGRWIGGSVDKFEDLIRRDNAGIIFNTTREEKVTAIAKFAQVVTGIGLPSVVTGWEYPKQGDRFHGVTFKIEWYKNYNVVIKFPNRDIADRFGKALFTEPEELLRMLLGKAEAETKTE